MTSDDPPAHTAASRPPSPGSTVTFRCARCTLFKRTPGRRLQAVDRVRQWVCAGCVRPEAKR
jgi:hypothetical protein